MPDYNQIFTSGPDTFTTTDPATTYTLEFIEGSDTLNVRAGTINASMGPDNDTVQLYGASDGIITGDTGNDTFNIRVGQFPTLDGGIGDDRFNFLSNSDTFTVSGGAGNDLFLGNGHFLSAIVSGDDGNDTFVGFGSSTSLAGGTGDDLYRVGPGGAPNIVENNGEGIDSIQLATNLSYTMADNVENLRVIGFSDGGENTALITGNASDNHIAGSNYNEVIDGADGNDNISGNGGDDFLLGNSGNDRLYGGSGNDSLAGGDGNDLLNGGIGDDTMLGGTGNDVYYVDSVGDVVGENTDEGIDTERVSISGLTLADNVENGILTVTTDGNSLAGNELDNNLYGSAYADALQGFGGDDTLRGGAGADFLDGGDGNDVLIGGTGADLMGGGAGNDTYYVDDAGDNVVEFVGEGTDTVHESLASYTLGSDVENGYIATTTDGSSLTGNALDNLLVGNAGVDILDGGDGNDTLQGGAGGDYFNGGSGADVFLFTATSDSDGSNGLDQINDYSFTQGDIIDLSQIDANVNLAGDQAFHYVASFTDTAGELRVANFGGGFLEVLADVDGDGNADFGFYVQTDDGSLNITY